MGTNTGLSPKTPNKYVGPNVYLAQTVTRNREPTGADYRQPETGKLYPLDTYWLVGPNPTTGVYGELWYLSKIVANVAFWLKLTTGGAGPSLGFVVPFGSSPVFPNGAGLVTLTSNGGTIVITGSPNTINFDITGAGTAVESFQVDAFTPPGTNPVLPDGTGKVTITGGQVAAGTTTHVIRTDSLAANTFTIEIQRSQAVASSTIGDNGVSHYNSNDFIVDSNAFVSITANAKNYVNVVGPTTYVVLTTDHFISCNSTAGAITLQFPNAPTFKQTWIVKDRTGTASTNHISVTTVGGTVTIDGQTTYLITSNYGAINLLANATPTYEVY